MAAQLQMLRTGGAGTETDMPSPPQMFLKHKQASRWKLYKGSV